MQTMMELKKFRARAPHLPCLAPLTQPLLCPRSRLCDMDGMHNFNQSRASSIGPVRSRGRGARLAMHAQTTPPRVRPMDEFGSHDHGHQPPPSQQYYRAPSQVPDTFLHQIPRPEHGRAMYERSSSEVEAYQDVSQSFDPAQVELALRQAGVVNNEHANVVRAACQVCPQTLLCHVELTYLRVVIIRFSYRSWL
jgi:hypothetical protein